MLHDSEARSEARGARGNHDSEIIGEWVKLNSLNGIITMVYFYSYIMLYPYNPYSYDSNMGIPSGICQTLSIFRCLL